MRRIFASATLTLVLVASGAGAQGRAVLGPVDGPTSPPDDLNRIKVGDPAPDFALASLAGRVVRLSEFRDRKTVVLAFYRGHW